MPPIYVPAKAPEDWKQFLAEPEKHWKTGFSAKTLAYSWHDADGLPSEIVALLRTVSIEAIQTVHPLLIIPERITPIAGNGEYPHNDVFVLGKAADGQLVSVTVEGKVDEPFGDNQSVAVWKLTGQTERSLANRRKRLDDLLAHLSLPETKADTVAYQLIQRTASAVIEAETFQAKYAVMVVHSFSPTHANFEQFDLLVNAFGQKATIGQLVEVSSYKDIRIFVGWAQGDPRYLSE